ncbi:hypothetical protein pb186bvf_013402 [Paramecium bursaria]
MKLIVRSLATKFKISAFPPQLLIGSFITYNFLRQNLVRMDSFQNTIATDCHPNCAVVVIKLKNQNPQTLKAIKSIIDIENKFPKTEDQELQPVLIGVGFQTKYWEKLSNKTQPDYEPRVGQYGNLPYGQGDLILHIKGETFSQTFEAVQQAISQLPTGSYEVLSEKYGFKYQDGRDLSGFLDGTMNPAIYNQRVQVGVNQQNGSYLIHQVWQHKLPYINSLPVEQQEQMVGRRKPNSLELSPPPKESHVARTRDENNKRLLIVRQSMPYGTNTGEHGLLFLAYAKDVNNFNIMLDRMTGKPDGINDQIMQMSINTFGNYYYIPSIDELHSL